MRQNSHAPPRAGACPVAVIQPGRILKHREVRGAINERIGTRTNEFSATHIQLAELGLSPTHRGSAVSKGNAAGIRREGIAALPVSQVRRKQRTAISTSTSAAPKAQTIAAPIGKSTRAVTNRLTTLARVAMAQPTANRAAKELTR
jgi:hypothetical protein